MSVCLAFFYTLTCIYYRVALSASISISCSNECPVCVRACVWLYVCVSVCLSACVYFVLFFSYAALHHALVYYVIMLEFSAGSAAFLLLPSSCFVCFSGYFWPFFQFLLCVFKARRLSVCLWLVTYEGQRSPPQITMLQNTAASFHRELPVTFFWIVPTAHAERRSAAENMINCCQAARERERDRLSSRDRDS